MNNNSIICKCGKEIKANEWICVMLCDKCIDYQIAKNYLRKQLERGEEDEN